MFDIIFSSIGIMVIFPFLYIITLLIKLDSRGPVIFIQKRVGRHNKDFNIFKFRTMKFNSKNLSNLTIGNRDERITKVGYLLRKYKLDELPQLFNVLLGNMSFVGPRPELRCFVNYYNKSDLEILNVKPGITDYASITYRNETELLKARENPEQFYINSLIPKKIKLNKQYLEEQGLFTDFSIIFRTINTIIFK